MDIQPLSRASLSSFPIMEKSDHAAETATVAKPTASPVEIVAAVQQPAPVPNLAQLAQAVKSINKAFQEQYRDLEFSIDADSNRTIIKVVDQKTKEVLRQIPSEEVLEISKALDRLQQGLLIRQKA